MWKTHFVQDKGEHDVVLCRDDKTFVIGVIDWWSLSATRYLADKALKENDLDFKASELHFVMRTLYGPPRRKPPVWTTNLVANGDSHDVHLLRDGAAVAIFSLEEFAGLSANKFAVEDAVEVAGGLAVHGRNMKEADKYLAAEFGDYEEEELDDGAVPGSEEDPHKR
jgi:hypothetical protein